MYSRSLLLVLYKFRYFCALLCTGGFLWYFSGAVHTAWTLISLPLYWPNGSSEFIISQESDGFDVTFANYSSFQTTAGKGVIDNVPAILHHIMLGSRAPESTWNTARQSCLDWHPGFDYHLWTDENAATFVAEKFPDLKAMWDAYRLPIQRVDALRYMILHEYGGIILDMDLQCRRSLGPLRQFKFVAPAAHPTGFSVSFLMASRANEFVGNILQNLKTYDRNWFYLPYVTVMFSTGGHFASALHARLPNRAESKILSGPLSNPKLHSLNGQAVTPIFNHLGSSSWHSFDGWFLMLLGRHIKLACILGGISVPVILVAAYIGFRSLCSRTSTTFGTDADDLEKRA